MPWPCAAARPSATAAAISTARRHDSRSRASRALSVSPVSSSVTATRVARGPPGPRLVAEVVDGEDVRVFDAGERLGLALEAGQAVGVGGDRLGQDLDGHVAVQALVAGAVDLAHAACAQRGEDLIRAETIAGLHQVLAWATARPRRSLHMVLTRAKAGPPAPMCLISR